MTKAFERAMAVLLVLIIIATTLHCGLVVGALSTLAGFGVILAIPLVFKGFSWVPPAEPQ